jgi:hypothetical protein
LTVPRADLVDLDPGEAVHAVARASFRGAAAISTRATFALGSGRMRMRAFHDWQDAASACGFPEVPPDMVVVVTDRRVLFGKPTFWGAPPTQFWSAVEHSEIAQIVAVQHGVVTGVAFGLANGGVVEIEAIRGRRLRRAVRAIEDHLPHKER